MTKNNSLKDQKRIELFASYALQSLVSLYDQNDRWSEEQIARTALLYGRMLNKVFNEKWVNI